MMKIEINRQFGRALDMAENSGRNIFITGRAGTGKSTLLTYFRDHTKKKIVILAPTGVAALNVAGQTIHSFFGFGPDITLKKVKKLSSSNKRAGLYKKLETIIIDEISMVRADLLDCIDRFMRLNGRELDLPFGGVQMIFIGDLYQLPPVVTGSDRLAFSIKYKTPFFFSSDVFQKLDIEYIELDKIYRQKDQSFIDLLNAVRNNSITDEQIELLNARHNPDYEISDRDYYVYLTPTNSAAEAINISLLNRVDRPEHRFYGEITGEFDNKSMPTHLELSLKIGSQVMMLVNDSCGEYVNGTIARIIKIKKMSVYNEAADKEQEERVIIVKTQDGMISTVWPYTWKMYRYEFDRLTGMINSSEIGSFCQYPMKLAWALTIHKSQGKTFDKVILDIDRGAFAHGQTYVALSRCTSFDGLLLKKRLLKKHIFVDWRVADFVTKFQYKKSDTRISLEKKIELIEEAIKKNRTLEITYLKTNDTKSCRVITPEKVGQLTYLDKSFLGVEAYCHTRKEDRVFRVDRILDIVPGK